MKLIGVILRAGETPNNLRAGKSETSVSLG
jgi:hypothetical protein